MDEVYEHLRNDLKVKLSKRFQPDEIAMILGAIDNAFVNYDITQKSKELTVYEYNTPDIVEIYLVSMKVDGQAKGTLYAKRKNLELFFRTVGKQPSEVTALDVRAYKNWYMQHRNVKACTADNVIRTIRTFYNWAIDNEYLEKNPARIVKDSDTEKRRRNALTKTEFEQMRIACETKRERALIEFLAASGCRVSECANIKMDKIDWQNMQISVIGKGNKERIVHFNSTAAVYMKEYLREGNRSIYLFGRTRFNQENLQNEKPLSRESIEHEIKAIANRTGIQKKISPHVLRHTYATFAVEAGMPIQSVQKTMGHANINTTMRYTHESEQSVAADYRRYVV